MHRCEGGRAKVGEMQITGLLRMDMRMLNVCDDKSLMDYGWCRGGNWYFAHSCGEWVPERCILSRLIFFSHRELDVIGVRSVLTHHEHQADQQRQMGLDTRRVVA